MPQVYRCFEVDFLPTAAKNGAVSRRRREMHGSERGERVRAGPLFLVARRLGVSTVV